MDKKADGIIFSFLMGTETKNLYPNIEKEMANNSDIRRLYALRASLYSQILRLIEGYISRKRIRTDVVNNFYKEIIRQKYIPEYFLKHHEDFLPIISKTDTEVRERFFWYINEMEKTIEEIKRILNRI